jgi:transcriptional regulator with XRE-family HTH domain
MGANKLVDSDNTFGTLLRRYRLEAGLSQEELAERAGLSANGLGFLERGIRQRPHRETVALLSAALSLGQAETAALEAASRKVGPQASAPIERKVQEAFLGADPVTPLIGRSEELNRIAAILTSVKEGRGHLLLLTGEAGSGKTRLLQELTRTAGERGFAVTAAASKDTESQPYKVLRRALAVLFANVPVDVRAAGDGRWRKIQTLMQPAVTGEGAALPDDDLLADISELVVTASEAVPIALLVDDVEAVDPNSLEMLHYLARMTHNFRVLIACSLSSMALEQTYPRLAELLQRMSHDRFLDIVTVRRLSYDETFAFITETMGGAVSEEFVTFAHRRTKGNPRLLDGLVRSLGGRLQLEGEIGAGAMGRVFRAYDSATQSTVAAKLMLARAGIDMDALLRFQQEGAVLRSMNHPNIVRIYDSFVDEHVSCIIMELLDGQSLARILAEGQLDLERTKTIALQIADALAYAHSQSIVHRDVKPDNIMVLKGDEVKVTDFGIARILSVDTLMGTVATTGMRVGTPLYMSPEQIEGKHVDARSDVYGFGAVLYHMVAGRPPFEGEDALSIAVQQMKDAPVRPSSIRPGLPPEWDRVILKALSKNPRRRFQSVKDMKAAVEALGTHAVDTSHRFNARRRLAAAGGLLLIVALIGSLLGYSAAKGNGGGATLSSYLAAAAAQGQLSGTVLVAKHGKVILDQGYGLADRSSHLRNGSRTEYGLADATTTALLTADTMQVAQPAEVYDWIPNIHATFCGDNSGLFLVTGCPPKWRKITIAELVDGSSRLPNYHWGRNGESLAQTEAACMKLPLEGRSSPPAHYTTCANIVMALLDPGVVTPVPAGSWMPTGLIPSARGSRRLIGHPALVARVPRLAHQLFDGLQSPRLALDYDRSGRHVTHEYNDYFATYSTARDLFTYDNLLFGGRYMPPANTRAELSPRRISAPPAPGINHVEWARGWKTGLLFGARVVYTAGSLYNFQTANLRFPQTGVTVIVLSNSASTDALNTAEHAAAFVLPGEAARQAATGPSTIADLLGTYRRTARPADYPAVGYALSQAFSDGLSYPKPGASRMSMTLRINWRRFRLGNSEPYAATNSGSLSLFGDPPGASTHFCTGQTTDLTPTGYYRWSILGRTLTITRVSDPLCADRAELVPGTWARAGK